MERAKEIQRIIHTSVVTLAFFSTVIFLYTGEIPASQEKYALIVLGALIAEFRGVGSYLTGSTASSTSKDATIAQMATTPTGTMTTTATSPSGAATVTTTGIAPETKP